MNKYSILPATRDHVLELSETIRSADRDELWALARRTPYEALSNTVMVSRDPMAGLVDGKVCVMWGVGLITLVSDSACPWLLATDDLPNHARPFLRASKKYVAEMKRDFKVLKNFVDARNTEAMRWLEWLEFDIKPAIKMGADMLPFHPFEMVNE
jgi:hypothetical protein